MTITLCAPGSTTAAGAATVSGSLVFGIGTEGNNGIGSATVLTVDTNYGDLTTDFEGRSLTESFFDSGSNALYFADSGIAQCSDNPGFYCPNSTLNLSATNVGLNGTNSLVSFSVVSVDSVSNNNPTYAAFSGVGGTSSYSDSFDWGLPLFFGRNVYTAIDGQNSSAGMGPYFAY